jgi:hypothetical protein
MPYISIMDTLEKFIAEIKQGKRTSIRLGSGDRFPRPIRNFHILFLWQRLGVNAPIYELAITSNEVDDDGVKVMLCFKNLRYLAIDSDKITNQAAIYIAKHPRLAYLYITSRNIDHQAFKILARKSQFKLLVFYNCFDIKEVHADDFAPNTQLTRLGLSGSPIGDAGVEVLAKLPFLKDLDISDVEMTKLSAPALLANTNLLKLNISTPVWYHKIGIEAREAIEANIKQNRQRVRTEFVQAMLTIFTGKSKENNTFTIADFPMRLKVYIFKCFDFNALHRKLDIGQACVEFVAKHLGEIRQRIQQKVSIQLLYKRAEEGQWHYFFKQPFSSTVSTLAVASATGKRKLEALNSDPLAEETLALQRPRQC